MITRVPYFERPHFVINNNKITAGGLLIIDYENEKCLLQYSIKKNRFEDLGGKINLEDDTIVHTIVRELFEETNELMGSKDNQLSLKNAKFFYIKESKYILIVVTKNNINIEDDLSMYGMIEDFTNIHRHLEWIDIKNILNHKIININPRIMNYFNNTCNEVNYLFDFIQKNKGYFYEKVLPEKQEIIKMKSIGVQTDLDIDELHEIKREEIPYRSSFSLYNLFKDIF